MDATKYARDLMSGSTMAALATLSNDLYPVTTLVTFAVRADGRPLLLLSDLALHARNLAANPRASLLLREEHPDDTAGDPMACPRLTLIGHITLSSDAADRACFLARHPQAQTYVDFTDFRFYEMAIERAHFVAGFGRIVEIAGADLRHPAP